MELDGRQTLIFAIIVFFFGKYLNRKFHFLRSYNIPEAVTGGVVASIIFGAIYALSNYVVTFNLELRDALLIVFFTAIGLSTKAKSLIEGGKPLFIMMLLASVYIFIQNIMGVYVMKLFGENPAIGILGGSVALQGGHGTVIAWESIFGADYKVGNAMEIGIAVATFGLVMGGLLGGPVARFLIKKHDLKSEDHEPIMVGKQYDTKLSINVDSILSVLWYLAVAIGFGIYSDELLRKLGINLPLFVHCMLYGMILTNLVPKIFPKAPNLKSPIGSPALAVISDISLGLFMAMSLMSLQLWILIELAIPLLAMLACQVVLILIFTFLVLFRALGKNYDAAVISAGYIGSALGATPIAMANMSAITKSYGPSRIAFIIIPIVGAFFIHLINSFVVEFLLNWMF